VEVLKKHFDTALESPEGIKKLRELILTLAMQGKLVPQDPKDPPAGELLKEIQAEKEKLIAEGKIKKQKELPEIKPDEEPYEVPEGWVWTRLEDIGEINPRNSFDDNKDAGFVPMPKIFADYGLKHSFEKRKWADIKKGYTHFSDGDIGLAKITPCFENGKSCVFEGLPNKMGAGTTELHIFRNTFSAIFPHFLLLYIKNPKYISEGQKKMTGSAGQKRVPTDYFSRNPFPLPPLAEQKRIVAKIDELMALCNKLEEQRTSRVQKRLAVHTSAINRLLTAVDKKEFDTSWQFITRHFDPIYSVKENVAELKKAILTLAMQGKLVPQDPNDPPASELLKEIQAEKEKLIAEGKIKRQRELPAVKPEEAPYEVPEGWVWVRFYQITINRDGERKPVSKDDRKHMQGDYDYYGASGVIDKVNNYLFDKNLLLIGEDGANLLSRSTPIAFIAKGKYWVNNHAHVIDSTIPELLLFLEKYFASIKLDMYVTGTAQPKMNQEKMNSILIALPPLAEQKRIVAKIDELMTLCDKLETQIDQATQKQTALFNAVLAKVSTKCG
jgi:type I restriction enzyme S subunit